jgi:hypothetical protein
MAYFGRLLRNYADNSFGTTTSYGQVLTSVPRSKHAFIVEFFTTRTTGKKEWRKMLDGLTTIVQTCDLPDFQFNTQTLNQYNRKRIIQTKVEWQPISIKFFDTRDNKFQDVMQEYFAWYYKDGRSDTTNFGSGAFVPDTVNDRPFIDYFGFQPPFTESSTIKNKKRFSHDVPFSKPKPKAADIGETEEANGAETSPDGSKSEDPINFEKYFFSKIVITRQYGGRKKLIESPITIFNPTITAINHDTLDYGTAQPITWTVTFAYEGVSYAKQKVPDINGGPDWLSRGASAAGDAASSAGQWAGETWDSIGSGTDPSDAVTANGAPYTTHIAGSTFTPDAT